MRWLVLGVAVLAGLWLAYQIVTVAQARRYADSRPEEALAWRPNHAAALGQAAEDVLLSPKAREHVGEAAALARRGLVASPLQLRSLRLLGALATMAGQEKRAEALMTLAAKRSLRDPGAHVWLFERRIADRDWKRAFFHADVLMRKPPRGYDVVSIVALVATEPGAADALVERMRSRPGWRVRMVSRIALSSPGLAFDILAKLSDAGSPPSDAEAAPLVRRMIEIDAVPQAYLAWVQFLPPAAAEHLADIYDGDFEGRPGAPPFNWRLGKKADAGADIGPGPDGDSRALYARHGAGRPTQLAGQILMLPAGRYRLTTRAYAEETGRGAQLRWSLTCYRQKAPLLAELSAPDEAFVWRDSTAPFEIPASGCDAQTLQLTGFPGEEPGVVRAWFDRVAVQRLF